MWLKLTAVGCKLRSSHMSTAYRSSFRAAVVWLSIMPNGRRRHCSVAEHIAACNGLLHRSTHPIARRLALQEKYFAYLHCEGAGMGWRKRRRIGSEKSPSQTSDSEETEFNKKRYKFITRKYFQLWRHNVHAAKRKVALRKVSSMMEKLMRQKKSRKMCWT